MKYLFCVVFLGITLAAGAVLAQGDRKTGMVKWFSNTKGFGFITPETGGHDVFVRLADVQAAGLATLQPGQRIHYELGGDRIKSAVHLQLD